MDAASDADRDGRAESGFADGEVNLFIIWDKGRALQERILGDIAGKFEILRVLELRWERRYFAAHLAKFYGKNLPKGCKKQNQCGTGPFLLVVVSDATPCYREGENVRMTQSKALYRGWFEGGNFLHSSDNRDEAEANLRYLLGMGVAEFTRRHPGLWDGRVERRDPPVAAPSDSPFWLEYMRGVGSNISKYFKR